METRLLFVNYPKVLCAPENFTVKLRIAISSAFFVASIGAKGYNGAWRVSQKCDNI
jgi:hypothetical protein